MRVSPFLIPLAIVLTACSTTPYSLVPSPGFAPFGGLGESSSVYDHDHVYYVADVGGTETELIVTLRVYNKSLRTVAFDDATLTLEAQDRGLWKSLERTTNLHPVTAMTVDEQLASSRADYNKLTQMQDVLPDPDFKAREKRIATRLTDLEQKKAQGVILDSSRSSDIHPNEQIATTTNFRLSSAKRLKIAFADDEGNRVEVVYEKQ